MQEEPEKSTNISTTSKEHNEHNEQHENSEQNDQHINKLGLVQIYTGEGKGKTTAALGLGLRAVGKGFNVYMIQFMKGDIDYGEILSTKNIVGFTIEQFGRSDFVDRKNPEEIDIGFAKKALERAQEILLEKKCDILILDEVNVALDWKLIELNDIINLIKNKPKKIELILTGRYADPKLIELADLVTEMKEIKHPYHKGILARDGIEH